jgi:uncharacterized protein YbaP (TraB family)
MRWFPRLIAPLGALFVTACSGSGQAEVGQPALWRVSDPDTTVYLFGTVHMLPDGYKWRTATFDTAAARADTLVLEIADINDAAAQAATFKSVAVARGLPPILDRVPTDKRLALAGAIEKAGLKTGQLDGLKTWAAALTIGTLTSQGGGASADNGIDKQLGKLFRDSGRTVAGLETTPQQLGYFDTLPEAAQRQLLAGMIDDAATGGKDVNAMIAAWGKGDVKKIAVTFDEELKVSPELAERLIGERNRSWVKWIEQRMGQPGTAMVAVGAGHLAGNDSVLRLLAADGYKIERLQ